MKILLRSYVKGYKISQRKEKKYKKQVYSPNVLIKTESREFENISTLGK